MAVAPHTLTTPAHISSPSQQAGVDSLEAEDDWQQDGCEVDSMRFLDAEQQPPENGHPPWCNATPPYARAATATRLTKTFVNIFGLQKKYG